jgi:hypothetical protein
MTWRRTTMVVLAGGITAALGGACKDGGSGDGAADDGGCIGAKCDDLDGLDDGVVGKLDVPAVRADLGVEPSGTCDASCAVFSGCLGTAEGDCLLDCAGLQADAAAHSGACEAAADALLVCVAGLDCDAAAAYQAGTDGYPCAAEDQGAAAACAPVSAADPACEGFCTLAAGCTESDAKACASACAEAQAGAEAIGPACGEAQRAVFECVGALADCAAFDDWTAAAGDHPCAAADAAVADACTTTEEG